MKNRFPDSRNDSFVSGSLKGKLLVASEELTEGQFIQAVILLLQDDAQGTIGVILNRPADDQLKRHWRQLSGGPEHVTSQLVKGGPVGGPVFAIHKFQSLGEMELPGDISVSYTHLTLPTKA